MKQLIVFDNLIDREGKPISIMGDPDKPFKLLGGREFKNLAELEQVAKNAWPNMLKMFEHFNGPPPANIS